MVAEGVFTTANLVSYCSAEDVLALLRAYDTSEWGAEEELLVEVVETLARARSAIEAMAGRDFFLHANETVRLDGSGSRVLLLGASGLTPVVSVERIGVNGRELADDAWLFYADEAAVVMAASSRYGRQFPEGAQNVEVTLDWGYEETPGEIRSAQAKLAAAELLARHTGEQGGVEAVSLGDYTVRYGSEGRFAHTIRRLVAEAREAAARYRRLDFRAI
ncbi:MAG: hypothetical protein ACOX9R_19925 [Armatimonadota bacterium]|jgi:hypothetical protein